MNPDERTKGFQWGKWNILKRIEIFCIMILGLVPRVYMTQNFLSYGLLKFIINKVNKRENSVNISVDKANIIQETEGKSAEIIIEMTRMASVPRKVLSIQRKAAEHPGKRYSRSSNNLVFIQCQFFIMLRKNRESIPSRSHWVWSLHVVPWISGFSLGTPDSSRILVRWTLCLNCPSLGECGELWEVLWWKGDLSRLDPAFHPELSG